MCASDDPKTQRHKTNKFHIKLNLNRVYTSMYIHICIGDFKMQINNGWSSVHLQLFLHNIWFYATPFLLQLLSDVPLHCVCVCGLVKGSQTTGDPLNDSSSRRVECSIYEYLYPPINRIKDDYEIWFVEY